MVRGGDFLLSCATLAGGGRAVDWAGTVRCSESRSRVATGVLREQRAVGCGSDLEWIAKTARVKGRRADIHESSMTMTFHEHLRWYRRSGATNVERNHTERVAT